jgi:copper resistance protein C
LLIARRFRGASLLIVLWLAMGARPAGAHAILVDSSVGDQPMAADVATAVTLRFNAAIEVGLSQAHLVDAQRAERPLSVAPGKSKGEMIVNVPALTPGSYGLKYRVLAADGHLSDGIVRFTVAATR